MMILDIYFLILFSKRVTIQSNHLQFELLALGSNILKEHRLLATSDIVMYSFRQDLMQILKKKSIEKLWKNETINPCFFPIA